MSAKGIAGAFSKIAACHSCHDPLWKGAPLVSPKNWRKILVALLAVVALAYPALADPTTSLLRDPHAQTAFRPITAANQNVPTGLVRLSTGRPGTTSELAIT